MRCRPQAKHRGHERDGVVPDACLGVRVPLQIGHQGPVRCLPHAVLRLWVRVYGLGSRASGLVVGCLPHDVGGGALQEVGCFTGGLYYRRSGALQEVFTAGGRVLSGGRAHERDRG